MFCQMSSLSQVRGFSFQRCGWKYSIVWAGKSPSFTVWMMSVVARWRRVRKLGLANHEAPKVCFRSAKWLAGAECRSNCVGRASLAESCVEWTVRGCCSNAAPYSLRSSYKSRQSGFMELMRASFFFREPALIL
jgi:hypothetical protein